MPEVIYHDPTREVHGEGRQKPFAAAVYRERRERTKKCKGCARCGRERVQAGKMEKMKGAEAEEGNEKWLGTGLKELLLKGIDKRLGRRDYEGGNNDIQ